MRMTELVPGTNIVVNESCAITELRGRRGIVFSASTWADCVKVSFDEGPPVWSLCATSLDSDSPEQRGIVPYVTTPGGESLQYIPTMEVKLVTIKSKPNKNGDVFPGIHVFPPVDNPITRLYENLRCTFKSVARIDSIPVIDALNRTHKSLRALAKSLDVPWIVASFSPPESMDMTVSKLLGFVANRGNQIGPCSGRAYGLPYRELASLLTAINDLNVAVAAMLPPTLPPTRVEEPGLRFDLQVED